MLVELTEVQGPLDAEVGKIHINPRHVILVRRGANVHDAEKQAFVTELTVDQIGRLRVAGSPTEVKRQLNGGAR